MNTRTSRSRWPRGMWCTTNDTRPLPPQPQHPQRHLPRQPASNMPTTIVPISVGGPRTVVVGDMMVAEDSDSSDCEDEEDEKDDTNDDDSAPRVLRVISRGVQKVDAAEPAWHALLRRSGSSRTASIACTVPRPAPPPPPPPAAPAPPRTVPRKVLFTNNNGRKALCTSSRIVRATGPPRPAVHVPAKVLVPRGRLLFPMVSRGRGVPVAVNVSRAPPAPPAPPAPSVSPRLSPGTRQDAGDATRCSAQLLQLAHPHLAVSVAAPGQPLSRSESAVLDGVLDMMQERDASDIAAYMAKYLVSSSDTFLDA